MISQHDEIICSWSVDELLVVLGRECVLDHIFDVPRAYNVCVTAFNAGELRCCLFCSSFASLVPQCS